jgi:hypothetical protein
MIRIARRMIHQIQDELLPPPPVAGELPAAAETVSDALAPATVPAWSVTFTRTV